MESKVGFFSWLTGPFLQVDTLVQKTGFSTVDRQNSS